MTGRTGVWLIGARGGVATTVLVGALALQRGSIQTEGLLTETEALAGVGFLSWSDLVFGGHDIRGESLVASARQIHDDTHTIPWPLLEALTPELSAVESHLRPGVLHRSGAAIEALAETPSYRQAVSTAQAVDWIVADLVAFREEHQLARLVVVNLSSTEPSIAPHPDHETAAGLARLVAGSGEALIASTLYALAAARAGAAYINFTPSPGALLPGVAETFSHAGLPFMGSDGKTGETLVKSALAPMFRYRNLRVLSWQGYNMLGDRDGEVLQHDANRQAKISSKDKLLHDYLGYPLHTQVRIDYVPSLKDLKTAWDFIHFQGFLGARMSLQFTWQGCDSILAAPLVLDLVRFADLALRRGEVGSLAHLAVFFKRPYGLPQHDLHGQFHALMSYADRIRASDSPPHA